MKSGDEQRLLMMALDGSARQLLRRSEVTSKPFSSATPAAAKPLSYFLRLSMLPLTQNCPFTDQILSAYVLTYFMGSMQGGKATFGFRVWILYSCSSVSYLRASSSRLGYGIQRYTNGSAILPAKFCAHKIKLQQNLCFPNQLQKRQELLSSGPTKPFG